MSDVEQKIILLVEDDFLIAAMETRQLENAGYKIIHVKDGENAIDIVCMKKEPVDLILMDIDLGKGIDGTEAAREILKKIDIPVVFLSAHIEDEIVQKTEKITSYGYVVKDSKVTVLAASIKMAFKLFEANKKMENQKERLRTILHSIGDAVIATDLDGKIIQMNPIAEKLTGWKFDEANDKPLNEIFNIFNAQTREISENPVDLVLKSGEIIGLANHTILISRDGAEYQIADSGSPIKAADGKIIGVVLVFRDVTQEYQIQKKIEESEKLYHSLFENMLNGFAYCKMIFENNKPVDFVYISVNKSFGNLTGLKNVEGRKISEIIPEMQKSDPELFEIYGRVSMTGIPQCFEIYVKSLKMWFAISVYSIQKGYFGIVFDVITDRKLAEEKLHDSLMKLNSAQEVAKIGFWNLELSDMKLEWSEGLKLIFELDPNEATPGYNIFGSYIFNDDKKFVDEMIKKQLSPMDVSMISYVYRIVTKNGNIKYLEHIGRQIIDSNGRLIRIYGAVQDISCRKNIEKTLRSSERQLSIIADNLPAYVAHVGADDLHYKFVNSKFETGFGMPRDKIIGQHIKDVIGESNYQFALKYINEVRAGREASYENVFNLTQGKRWIKVNYVPYFDDLGKVEGIIVLSFDITERKQFEEQINKLLSEKELILREVHHRVKNNMNTIFSLLILQANMQENLLTKSALQDAAGRVSSMMVLYDKLYHSENISVVSVKEYFPALINEIIDIFPKKASIKIQTNIDEFSLSLTVLSPLGIIINELITNAMKYAFIDRNDGVINVTVFKKENLVSIIFEDNGPGIPDSVTFENSKGFGLQLIKMLVKQIRGSLTVERLNGTRFIIEFEA